MPLACTAEIIAVGSELLTPYRLDTNSLFLSGRLNELGIVVHGKCVVGDDPDELAARLAMALSRRDVVLTTGGLGPTADDVTREVVADVLKLPLKEDPDIVETIQQRFQRRGARMPEINRRQALVPAGAVVLPNVTGTAPGLFLTAAGRVVVLLPGPPRELQPMFDVHVAPRLHRLGQGRRVLRRVIKITGRSESQIEEIAQPIYSTLRSDEGPIETTILAMPGQIELHLSAAGTDDVRLARTLDESVERLRDALGPVVFSVDGRSLEAVVGEALRSKHWRIAAAESCTGGLLMGRLTEMPGSSAWFAGGVVAYADVVKIQELDVPPEMLARHGAVSDPVALRMANGVRRRLATEVGVAVTGIAGPDGGSPEKPVGTVVIAVSLANAPDAVRTFRFPGDREMIRRHSTAAALDLVGQALLSFP